MGSPFESTRSVSCDESTDTVLIETQASADKQKTVEVGAELFVGNLDPMVDEKTLYDTFSRFGSLVSAPKIARDESALSKGYGFVSYSNFEASDDAIANMNGQYLMNKDISVQYAYKKDGKGERHGDEAERMLAAQAKAHNVVPEMQQMPPGLLMNGGIPASPMDPGTPQLGGPPGGMNLPPGFGGRPNGNYNSVPPPQQRTNAPLPPPPSGLPQRPPPSQAGYGGPPQDFHPPGFAPPPGFQNVPMPPGFNAGPPGGQLPPGFMPPPGFPPQGQQQGAPGYARR
jgi:splicing factor 3B subunit 4